MLKPGMQRVLGVRVTPGAIEAAVLGTDGNRLQLPAQGLRRPLAPDEDGDLALAEVCVRLGAVGLVGLADGPLSAQMLASVIDVPVVSDFAAADRRLGGLGGPLEAFFHHALVRHLGLEGPVAVLHLGRTARLTWCDPRLAAPEVGCRAFDAGPGTAAMDALVQARLGLPHAEAALTARGHPDLARVEAYLQGAWFARLPPRSFAAEGPALVVDDLPLPDALATLATGIAAAVSMALDLVPRPPQRLLVAGGGRHNGALMAMLGAATAVPLTPVEDLGLPGDALPALALAFLAARVALGLPTSGPNTTGVAAPVGGGTLYHP